MKTTIKDFELFKKECQRWIEYFGLKNYRIEFFKDKEANNYRAMTTDYNEMMAIDITFPEELDDETDIKKIKTAAFHEICEIMLMRIRKMATEHFNWDLVDKEIHTIIRILENTIYNRKAKEQIIKKPYDKKKNTPN